MKKYWWAFLLGGFILVAAAVAISWYAFPAWQTRQNGILELLGISTGAVFAFLASVATLLQVLGVFKEGSSPPAPAGMIKL
ncbi:MAG: hypothetical protein WCE68_14410 [Anaerolineales bacterium]